MNTIDRLLERDNNIEISLVSDNIKDLFWVIYDLFDNTIYAQGAFQPPENEERFGLTLDPGVYQLVCSCHREASPSSIQVEVTNLATGTTNSSSAADDGLSVYTAKRPFVIPGDEA